MTETLLRGRILSFHREPDGHDDHDSYRFFEDGGLLMADGVIRAIGDHGEVARLASADALRIDHRPHLILPGFIDTHTHFPQMQVIASWGTQLLDWLITYTFPAEARYGDPAFSAAMATRFCDTLIRHGTTTVVAYGSVHRQSAEALFAEAERRGMRMVAGKSMMDRNAPDEVCDTAQESYDDSKALIETWHGRGRALYAITPRFAITSTPEQLEAVGALAREFPGCYVQTHLSENEAEIAETKRLFPEAFDYFGVYEHYGIAGPRSLFGHAIHLSPRERAAMAETGSIAVFCPTSNLFLGSGLFDEAGLRAAGVRCAIATDVGGGTSYSMLRTLDEGYKVLQMNRQKLDPLTAFYWITLGNARALGLDAKIGTLEVGSEADVVVLDPGATGAMAVRMETVTSLSEELFVLQTLGDDRAVVETYVNGVAAKQ